MKNLVYKCLDEKCSTEFKEYLKDGLSCPVCGSPIVAIREANKSDTLIPSYKELKNSHKDDEKKIELKINKSIVPLIEFQKLNLNNNDILVIKSECILKTGDKEALEKDLSEKFQCKVVVLDCRFSIQGILAT